MRLDLGICVLSFFFEITKDYLDNNKSYSFGHLHIPLSKFFPCFPPVLTTFVRADQMDSDFSAILFFTDVFQSIWTFGRYEHINLL